MDREEEEETRSYNVYIGEKPVEHYAEIAVNVFREHGSVTIAGLGIKNGS